jgi:hypothetical protein
MGASKIMSHISDLKWAVPWLRQLVTALSPWRTRFNPRPVHVIFKVVRMAMGQVSLQVLRFSHHYHSTSASFSSIYHWQYTTWAIDSIKKHTLLKCKYNVQWDYHTLCNNVWFKRQGDDKDEESAWCVMVQVVCHHPLTTEASVQPQGSPCRICGGKSGNRTGFSHNTSIFPLPIITSPLHSFTVDTIES